MRFGLSAPFRGPLANPSDIRLIAEQAEALGYDVLTVSDHLLVPRQIDPNYPYSDIGEFLWAAEGSTDCMEQFTLLAWLAAVTTDIRLLTSVVVVAPNPTRRLPARAHRIGRGPGGRHRHIRIGGSHHDDGQRDLAGAAADARPDGGVRRRRHAARQLSVSSPQPA